MIGQVNGRGIPSGFLVGACHAGIRKTKLDLAILFSEVPAVPAGVFTQNRVQAAPVTLCKKHLTSHAFMSAIVVNSGNANACTGQGGYDDAVAMATATARALGVPAEHVFVSSTGVIGKRLPMESIMAHISPLASSLSVKAMDDVAQAIMTTDLVPKHVSASILLPSGASASICGVAKGSGMIAPNMATMLGFVLTDASITKSLLQESLTEAVNRSFNRISVDGEQSTNDMVLVLANGRAGNKLISEKGKDYDMFCLALESILVDLAKAIARDGEGATKLIEIRVKGARTEIDADKVARAVANSPLVKTAIYGADANWGRIVCAAGYAGVEFDPEKISIDFDDLPVVKPNFEVLLDEEKAKHILSKDTITITIDMNDGASEVVFWTCDFSEKYVTINAGYRS